MVLVRRWSGPCGAGADGMGLAGRASPQGVRGAARSVPVRVWALHDGVGGLPSRVGQDWGLGLLLRPCVLLAPLRLEVSAGAEASGRAEHAGTARMSGGLPEKHDGGSWTRRHCAERPPDSVQHCVRAPLRELTEGDLRDYLEGMVARPSGIDRRRPAGSEGPAPRLVRAVPGPPGRWPLTPSSPAKIQPYPGGKDRSRRRPVPPPGPVIGRRCGRTRTCWERREGREEERRREALRALARGHRTPPAHCHE